MATGLVHNEQPTPHDQSSNLAVEWFFVDKRPQAENDEDQEPVMLPSIDGMPL